MTGIADGLPSTSGQTYLTKSEVRTDFGRRSPDEFAERFWSKVDKRAPDECWPWTGAILPNGYGAQWLAGRSQKAHRVAWILTYGPIADGVLICHTCDNRPCCNPGHLYAGDHKANTRDMLIRSRHNRDGKRHVNVEQVAAIRQLYSSGDEWTLQRIGDLFGITDVAVHLIVKRKTWRDVA